MSEVHGCKIGEIPVGLGGPEGKEAPSPLQTLDCPMTSNDAGAETVADYLSLTLEALWTKEADFTGKRPHGCTGWQSELIDDMARQKLVEGTLLQVPRGNQPYTVEGEDMHVEVDNCDEKAAKAAILEAIQEIRELPTYIRKVAAGEKLREQLRDLIVASHSPTFVTNDGVALMRERVRGLLEEFNRNTY